MLNQSFDLVGRRRTLESDGEGDVFECRPRSFQAKFVRDIKGATDIDLSFLDRNFVEMREPRNLGKQSKRSAHKEIRKRRWREISSATLLPLLRPIALETRTSDRPFQMDIFHDIGYRAKGNLSAISSCLDGGAESLIFPTHLF